MKPLFIDNKNHIPIGKTPRVIAVGTSKWGNTFFSGLVMGHDFFLSENGA